MITDDDVMRLFARADPARVDDHAPVLGATGYLDTLRTRSSTLTLIDTNPTTTTEPANPRRWPMIVAAAAAVVLVVVGTLAFAARDRDSGPEIPAAPPTVPEVDLTATAEEVVVGFLDASASFDVDRAASYLSEGALAGLGGRERMRLQAAWDQATGFAKSSSVCEPLSVSPSATTVRCPYDFQGIRSAELGLGPFSGSYDEFTVRDGTIVSVSGTMAFEDNGFSVQVWEPFAVWVSENYPDDVAIMYTDSSQSDYRLTDESVGLWEQHSLEYATR